MRTIIFDIETKPNEGLKAYCEGTIKPKANLKDVAKIAADIEAKKGSITKKMSTDIDLLSICMVGVKEVGSEDGTILSFEEFVAYIDAAFSDGTQSVRLVSFNGKAFDVPAIIKEAVRLDYNLPWAQLNQATKKWDCDLHVDIMEVLCPFGKFRSKDEFAKIYLGYDAEPIDFANATREELEAHCLEDLEVTEKLYELFNGKLY